MRKWTDHAGMVGPFRHHHRWGRFRRFPFRRGDDAPPWWSVFDTTKAWSKVYKVEHAKDKMKAKLGPTLKSGRILSNCPIIILTQMIKSNVWSFLCTYVSEAETLYDARAADSPVYVEKVKKEVVVAYPEFLDQDKYLNKIYCLKDFILGKILGSQESLAKSLNISNRQEEFHPEILSSNTWQPRKSCHN